MYECTFLLDTFAFIFISINCFKRNKNLTLHTLVNNGKKKQVFNNKLQHFKNAYVHGGRRELCVQKITEYMKENACL